jgi:hypothetical protein
MLAHMESEIPDVLELRRKNLPESWSEDQKAMQLQVPAWLLQIVAKCLQKDINNRYANGIELQEALMQGSIGAISPTNPDESWNTEVLLKENERLQGLVLYYQENENKQPVQVVNSAPIDSKAVRMSKPIFVMFIILLCGFTVFSAVVMDKFGGRIYHGVVNRLFKPSKKPADTATTKVILPAKKDSVETKPNDFRDESNIPPEVDSTADSILRNIQRAKQQKEDTQFYRDSVKKADTSNLNF